MVCIRTIREPPIAQMPQITGPDPLGPAAIGQLPKDGIDAIADSSEYCAPTVRGLRTGFAKGSQQDHPDLAQGRLHAGQPVVAVTQEQPAGACRHVPDDLALRHVSGSQVHLGDHAGPTQAHVQAKAVKGLAAGMIFAKAGGVVKATAAIGARKLTDGDWHTIHNGHRRIREQQAITHQTPQPFFHRPQVSGLPHKRTAIDVSQRRKKVR